MRGEPLRRLLQTFAVVYRAGARGCTSKEIQSALVNRGLKARLRTIQRDLETLRNELPAFLVENDARVGDGPRAQPIYFVDRTRRPAVEHALGEMLS